jgi:hypothetical protein
MLRNELFDSDTQRITDAWAEAAFSEAGGEALRRYYTFHLRKVRNISLIRHLLDHYAEYLDLDIEAPTAYHTELLRMLDTARLAFSPIPESLSNYLKEMSRAEGRFTYRQLRYFERLVGSIDLDDITRSLIRLNFNHPGFQTDIPLNDLPAIQSEACYPDWPSLSTLLIQEQPEHPKLAIDLSVAHLACWTRMAYETGLYPNQSVQEVMDHTCATYRTRRQDSISPGSFAKEYYGISQVTAAVVRDRLMRMVGLIDRNYFPPFR